MAPDLGHLLLRLVGAGMTNRKGTKEESRIVTWFKANGWPYARRIRQTGAKDEGDVILSETIPVVIESKAVKAWDASGWMKELGDEVFNAHADWGFVIIKKRGTTDPGEYYALLPVKYLNKILIALYVAQLGAERLHEARRLIRRR